MISPSKALASATESAVLPLAVGPPTATTRPNCFSSSFRVIFNTQGRPCGQNGGTVPSMMRWASASISAAFVRSPALIAARQAMECSTHSVFSRRASRPPSASFAASSTIISSTSSTGTSAGTARTTTVEPPKSSASMPASVRRSRFCKTACFSAAVRLTCTGTSSIWDGTLP